MHGWDILQLDWCVSWWLPQRCFVYCFMLRERVHFNSSRARLSIFLHIRMFWWSRSFIQRQSGIRLLASCDTRRHWTWLTQTLAGLWTSGLAGATACLACLAGTYSNSTGACLSTWSGAQRRLSQKYWAQLSLQGSINQAKKEVLWHAEAALSFWWCAYVHGEYAGRRNLWCFLCRNYNWVLFRAGLRVQFISWFSLHDVLQVSLLTYKKSWQVQIDIDITQLIFI